MKATGRAKGVEPAQIRGTLVAVIVSTLRRSRGNNKRRKTHNLALLVSRVSAQKSRNRDKTKTHTHTADQGSQRDSPIELYSPGGEREPYY